MSIESKVTDLENDIVNLRSGINEDRILLKQIHAAIIGDQFGNNGMNRRLTDLEEWRLKFIWISGATSAASFVIGLLAKTFWAWITTT